MRRLLTFIVLALCSSIALAQWPGYTYRPGVIGAAAGVTTFNTRAGDVTLGAADLSGAGGVLADGSVPFSGAVTATDFIIGSTSIAPIRCVSGALTGVLTLGTSNTATATCTGARDTMVVACNYKVDPGALVAAPKCYVSADDTVTVVETGLGVVTPTSTTAQIAVTP